jgi:GT2 family glycosyltransferase
MLENVAVVILNWNGKAYLERFLPSVIKYSGNARIIVADNHSTDDSIQFVTEQFPTVEIVKNDTNGGFAKGYNDALRKIDASYYLLLNSDIEVTENWILPLLTCVQQKDVVACQPKVLSYKQKNKFEHAGASGGFLDRNYYPFCRGRILEITEVDEGQYDNEVEIFWASGACLLIEAKVFHQENGFDELFFAHMEEIDLCWRLKRRGHRIKVAPSSVVYHVGGGTLDYMSPQKTYLNFRNSLLMITKNHHGNVFLKIFYRLILDGMAGLLFLAKGSPRHTYSVVRAHFSYYRLLPVMLKKRSQMKTTHFQMNKVGIYRGSILWAKYVKKINRYAQLNLRLFSND